MSKIKTKEIIKGTIKQLDKSVIVVERTKDNLVNIKEKVNSSYSTDDEVNEYASKKIQFTSNRVMDETVYTFNTKGKEGITTTKNNVIKTKNQLKTIKTKIKRNKEIKVARKNIKTGKVALQKSNQFVKNTKKIATKSLKATKTSQRVAKNTVRGVKQAVKITISAVKGIIAGTKALITALIAGGWVAVVVILIICLVALLCSSIYGVFFSNEEVGSDYKLNEVVKELNEELDDKILSIKNDNSYNDYKITSTRAEWKEILAIYVVYYSSNNDSDVLILTEEKKEKIKEVFWDMTSISSDIKVEEVDGTIQNILYIDIKGKTTEEIMEEYNFTEEQKEQVKDLLDSGYNNLWVSVIYGTDSSSSMTNIALAQVGNVGGEPYWTWYGFNSRVEWCAVFVSWVANELGYIDAGIIPKFVACINGVNWFKDRGLWQEGNYTPKESDIIFFDWEDDGSVDHVGIVIKVENNKVYTVEGNSTDDTCRQLEYSINNKVIYGYGTPVY